MLVKRGLVIASVVIVLVLSVVAIFSALDNATTDQSDATDQTPAPAGRAFPGERTRIDDASSPLSVGCLPASDGEPGPSQVYMVVVENLGSVESSYRVAANLTDQSGRSERLVIDIANLAAGQEAEEFLIPGQELDVLAGCTITAVETSRRVILLS